MDNNTPKEANMVEKQERNRKMLRVAGIVIILVIIAALVGNGSLKRSVAPTMDNVPVDCKPGDLFSQTTGKPCPTPTDSPANVDAAASVGPSGYEEAIRMYAGKVVIFDAACKPLPVAPTFAKGTRILVANNSTKTQTLTVAGKSEVLDAYHYFTVPLATVGDTVVTCNGAPAATISVK